MLGLVESKPPLFLSRKRMIKKSIFQCRSHATKLRTQYFSDYAYCSDGLLSEQSRRLFVERIEKTNKTHVTYWGLNYKEKAAVLIPFCTVNGEPSILFTKRSTLLRRNKGQVSFPGGIVDSTDESITHTALRETEEEIGLAPSRVDVWSLTPMLPDANLVTGVVGVVGNIGEISIEKLTPNSNEVASIFTVPIKTLVNPENIRYTKFRTKNYKASKSDYVTPVYLVKHKIWGLTATYTDIVLAHLVPSYQPINNKLFFKLSK